MRHGYAIVLGLVVLSFVVQEALPDGNLARLVVVWLQAATLVVAVRVAQANHRLVRAAAALATAAALAAPVVWIANGDIPEGVSAIATALLVGVAPAVIAAGLVRELRANLVVTGETLSGVLSIYMLAGMFFSFAYSAVEELGSPAFFSEINDPGRSDFLYFSYATLTTTGFGDLTAATQVGRTLAVTEALIGQIYLVTIVALIVSNLRPRRDRPA